MITYGINQMVKNTVISIELVTKCNIGRLNVNKHQEENLVL